MTWQQFIDGVRERIANGEIDGNEQIETAILDDDERTAIITDRFTILDDDDGLHFFKW